MTKKVNQEPIKINREYKGLDIKKLATRIGCMWFLDAPSRVGNKLFYLDGRIKHDEVLHGVSAFKK
jgi:hypothetical protein